MTFYDPLTRMANRRLFLDRLQPAVEQTARNDGQGALLFIDLDHFKALNDSAGHDVGDLMLKHVAKRLLSCVRQGDTVARLGGDEFVIILAKLDIDSVEATRLANKIGMRILATLNSGGREHFVEALAEASVQ